MINANPSCCVSGVEVACCLNPIPRNLTGTVIELSAGGPVDCEIGVREFELIYDENKGLWTGEFTANNPGGTGVNHFVFQLRCNTEMGDVWEAALLCSTENFKQPTLVECNPLELRFSFGSDTEPLNDCGCPFEEGEFVELELIVTE